MHESGAIMTGWRFFRRRGLMLGALASLLAVALLVFGLLSKGEGHSIDSTRSYLRP